MIYISYHHITLTSLYDPHRFFTDCLNITDDSVVFVPFKGIHQKNPPTDHCGGIFLCTTLTNTILTNTTLTNKTGYSNNDNNLQLTITHNNDYNHSNYSNRYNYANDDNNKDNKL